MYIKAPSRINDLWKGQLSSNEESIRAWENTFQKQGRRIKGDPLLNKSKLPLVSIGMPDVWRVQDLYPKGKIPKGISVKLEEADFYFVRLACSFRPLHKEIVIENARFSLFFQQTEGDLPIAYDMHPLRVEKEDKKNVRFSLNPTLKFSHLEASLVEIDFGFEYNELTPLIFATGVMESYPAWEFKEAAGYSLEGSKLMHLLMKVSKGLHPIFAAASIDAKLRAYGTLLNAIFGSEQSQAQSHLTMLLLK